MPPANLEQIAKDAAFFDYFINLIPANHYVPHQQEVSDQPLARKYLKNVKDKRKREKLDPSKEDEFKTAGALKEKAKQEKLRDEEEEEEENDGDDEDEEMEDASDDDDDDDDSDDDEEEEEDEDLEVAGEMDSDDEDEDEVIKKATFKKSKAGKAAYKKASLVSTNNELRDRIHAKLTELKDGRVSHKEHTDNNKNKKKERKPKLDKAEKKKLQRQRSKERKRQKQSLVQKSLEKSGKRKEPEAPSAFDFGRMKIGGKDVSTENDRSSSGNFAGGNKKRKLNDKQLLHRAEQERAKMERLKGTEEGNEYVQNKKWEKMMQRTAGVKVKDDPKLLKKTIKRKEKQKQKSSKKWQERLDDVKSKQKERQDKRTQNLKSRSDDKKKRKMGLPIKKKPTGGGRGKGKNSKR